LTGAYSANCGTRNPTIINKFPIATNIFVAMLL